MKEYRWAEKVDKIVFKFMYVVSIFGAIALMVVAVLCTVDSLGTRIFRVSLQNGTDWVTYLNIPVVFLSMGFIQVERGNTVVDILSCKFPKWLDKVVRIFGCLLGTAICGYLGYCEVTLTLKKFASHATASSSASSFVVWPFVAIVALGYILVAISFLWCIFREFFVPPEKRAGAMPMGGQAKDLQKPDFGEGGAKE